MHGVELSNMEYVEKSTVELPVFTKASKEEISAPALDQNVASKEETSAPALDQNVEMLKPAEKCRQETPAKSHPFLAPTPPSEPKSESSRIQIQPSARPPASSMSSIKSKTTQEEPKDLSLKRPRQLWPI
jgi:hypothetical protein